MIARNKIAAGCTVWWVTLELHLGTSLISTQGHVPRSEAICMFADAALCSMPLAVCPYSTSVSVYCGGCSCFHWESCFLPIKEPLALEPESQVAWQLRRRTSNSGKRLWYEWAVMEGCYSELQIAIAREECPMHNLNGHQHHVDL